MPEAFVCGICPFLLLYHICFHFYLIQSASICGPCVVFNFVHRRLADPVAAAAFFNGKETELADIMVICLA